MASNRAPNRALALGLPPATDVIPGRRGGPATKYTPELMAEILDRVAGGETLSEVCKEPAMPSVVQLRRWILGNPELRDAWFTAKNLKAGALFDEALSIARSMRTGGLATADVSALRVVLEHLRWAAGKLNPQEFGDKQPSTPTLAIQINTSLGMGASDKAAADGEVSVYKLVVPLEGQPVAEEPILDVRIPRKTGPKPKKREESPDEQPDADV